MALIQYKKAGLKYEVLETFTAGLELSGPEVKVLRNKQGSLEGSRVVVRGGEAFIVGMSLPAYQQANTPAGYDPERNRRLLLKKSELMQLGENEAKKGLTIVPLEVYNAGRYLKVRIAIVRGKNASDKRESLKRKDAQREMDRAMRAKK
ncbi:MAG: SsrA-binding protein SsrA-binding protein [Parcubacteria group bacterium]|nr:SsrA-binding protein SsrA-binding protein [Parcubacteria group bacterium]